MTVIVWDGQTLAADKRCGTQLTSSITKIRRAKNGHLLGCTGTSHGDAELLAWYENGANPDEFPAMHRDSDRSSYMIEITLDGKIQTYLNGPYPTIVEDRCMAIGSGSDFAMAAIYLGKTAREAVSVASALSASCGNGIDTLELE